MLASRTGMAATPRIRRSSLKPKITSPRAKRTATGEHAFLPSWPPSRTSRRPAPNSWENLEKVPTNDLRSWEQWHVPLLGSDLAQEKARIESMGGEVRSQTYPAPRREADGRSRVASAWEKGPEMGKRCEKFHQLSLLRCFVLSQK